MAIDNIFTPQNERFTPLPPMLPALRGAASNAANADGVAKRQSVRYDAERGYGLGCEQTDG